MNEVVRFQMGGSYLGTALEIERTGEDTYEFSMGNAAGDQGPAGWTDWQGMNNMMNWLYREFGDGPLDD